MAADQAPPAWAMASGGAMHPELRKRMHELGIGLSGDVPSKNVPSSPSTAVPLQTQTTPSATSPTHAAPIPGEGLCMSLHASPQRVDAGKEACVSSEALPQRANGEAQPSAVPHLRLPGSEAGDDVLAGAEHHGVEAAHSGAQASASRRTGKKNGQCSELARLPRQTDASNQQKPASDLSGLDPDVTELLMQLDGLDTRSKALQKQSAATCDVRSNKVPKEQHRPVDAVSKTPQKPAVPSACREAAATMATERGDAESMSTAAQAVARQHPLQSLESRWQSGARGRRDNRVHKAPQSHKVLDLAPAFADAFANAFAEPSKTAASPVADPRRAKASATGGVSLPSLKPSASAPGCLMHASRPAAALRA